jgi:hypothetical protein
MKKAIIFILILFGTSINTIAQKSDLYICDTRWNLNVTYDKLKINYFKIRKINFGNFFTMLDSMIYIEDTLINIVEPPIKELNVNKSLSVIIKQNDKEFIIYKSNYFKYKDTMYHLNLSIYLMYMNFIPLEYWKHATPFHLYLNNPLMDSYFIGSGVLSSLEYHPSYCSKFKQWRNKRKRKKLHW